MIGAFSTYGRGRRDIVELKNIVQAGVCLIELQLKRRKRMNVNYHGFDEVRVRVYEDDPNNVQYKLIWSHVNFRRAEFTYDKDTRTCTAFLPDTNDNRIKLSDTLPHFPFIVVQIHGKDGKIFPPAPFLDELKRIYKLRHKNRPDWKPNQSALDMAAQRTNPRTGKYLYIEGKTKMKAPKKFVLPEVNPVGPEDVDALKGVKASETEYKIFKKLARDQVHKKNEEFIKGLKINNGDNFQASEEYRNKILPEIDRLISEWAKAAEEERVAEEALPTA